MISLASVILLLSGCETGFKDPSREMAPKTASTTVHPEVIHKPDPVAVWNSPLVDDPTVPAHAECGTCHGPNPKNFGAALKPGERFHTNIEVQHGNLSCTQCHDPDRTKLHLADGTQFDFSEVMQLCSQCHGPQYRDYEHGAHGGMTGYWDEHRGEQVRNNCTDCHAPHSPAFASVMPVFPPRDRYYGEH